MKEQKRQTNTNFLPNEGQREGGREKVGRERQTTDNAPLPYDSRVGESREEKGRQAKNGQSSLQCRWSQGVKGVEGREPGR